MLIADTFLHIESDEFVNLDERNFGKYRLIIPAISSTEMKPLL